MKPFSNCDEAYAAGRANIPEGDPAYAKHLDRDGDGLGCDKPPANFKPAPVAEATTGTKVQSSADRLPQTGPGEVTAAGAILLLIGAVTTLALRRRRTRFVA